MQYYYSFNENKNIYVYDKRLSIEFYRLITYPLLNSLRNLILTNNYISARKILSKHIKYIRRNYFIFSFPIYNYFFDNLINHILSFLYSDFNKTYYKDKYAIELDYIYIIMHLYNIEHINPQNKIYEYIFNIFFDIEKYVSAEIFHFLELNYINL